MASSREANQVQKRLHLIKVLANLEQRLPDRNPHWRDHSAEKKISTMRSTNSVNGFLYSLELSTEAHAGLIVIKEDYYCWNIKCNKQS